MATADLVRPCSGAARRPHVGAETAVDARAEARTEDRTDAVAAVSRTLQTFELEPPFVRQAVLALLDTTTLVAATFSAHALACGATGAPFGDAIATAGRALALATLVVVILAALGTYGSPTGLLRVELVRRLLQAMPLALATIAVRNLAGLPTLFPPGEAALVLATGSAALVLQRIVSLDLLDRARDTPPAHVALIYGAGVSGRLLAQHLVRELAGSFEPAGFLDDDATLHGRTVAIGPGAATRELPVLGGEIELDRVLEERKPTVVFISIPSASSARVRDLTAKVESRGVPCIVMPGVGDRSLAGNRCHLVSGLPLLSRRRAAGGRASAAVKRTCDVLGASVLLVLTAPVFVVAAILVRRSSPGPAIFRQTRIGAGGVPFTIYKLRTMFADAPVYAHHPAEARDPRVTPVGAWLRRLSLDELPQLWNVLRGEMSLVGPRPEMPFIVAGYDEVERQRLLAKPGLTGLWQISPDRAFPIHGNMHYDLFYVDERSLGLDLAILVLTPLAIVAGGRAK